MSNSKSYTVSDTRGQRAEKEAEEEKLRATKQEAYRKGLLIQAAKEANYIVPIKPIGERLLIRNDISPDVSRGGIITPDTAKRRCTTGIIIDMGEGVTHAELKLGVRVLYGKYDGTPIEFGAQKNLTMLNQSEIRAIITAPLDDLIFGDGGVEG